MKAIPGFDGYYAGEDGFVYSVKTGKYKRLTSYKSKKHPYLMVGVHQNGKKTKKKIHTLILMAFVGDRPVGLEARHLDGNCLNNKPSNLKWGTRQENVDDKKIHGTIPIGTRNGRAKLTKEQVLEIISLKGDLSTGAIACKFNVAQTTISAIHTGRSWNIIE